MASCKDCVHVEACNGILNGFDIDIEFFGEQVSVCKNFKDCARFVELPCLPGDKVFYFGTDERIYVQTVESLIYGVTKTGFVINSEVDFISDLSGERFFLSYEEAERALKEREKNGQGTDDRESD